LGLFPSRYSELIGTQRQVAAHHATPTAFEQADPDVGRAEETFRYATELLGSGQGAAQRISTLQQCGVELVIEAGADGEESGK
jgi:hypothetical protein